MASPASAGVALFIVYDRIEVVLARATRHGLTVSLGII
jgi:hypothetical protein